MNTFDFAFVVSVGDPHADGFEDQFFDAGCDDATIALMHGAVALCFARESGSYKDAVMSAYSDIMKAGADILRFEPDYLVSQTEIAARAGLSRAAVSLYEKGERGEGFPKPCARITTSSPLWDWVDVSKWLCLRGKVDEIEYRSALVSRIVNYHVQTDHDYDAANRDVEAAMLTPIDA